MTQEMGMCSVFSVLAGAAWDAFVVVDCGAPAIFWEGIAPAAARPRGARYEPSGRGPPCGREPVPPRPLSVVTHI